MRIVYVVTVEKFFLSHRIHLARAARRAGAEVFVVSSKGPRVPEILAEGFKHVAVEFDRKSINPFKELRVVRELTAAFRAIQPDLVHNIAIKPVVYGSIAARICGIRAVVNAITGLGHTFASDDLRSLIARRALGALFRIALNLGNSVTLFQNPDDRSYFTENGILAEKKTCVILGSGVDTRRFLPAVKTENEVPVIVLPARMIWNKGVGLTVDASRVLKARGTRFKLLLAGELDENSPAPIRRAQLDQWKSEGLAEWIGFQKDMPDVLRKADIVALPSTYREGVPLALIEAASCGIPIVTLDRPGCREIVVDGLNGYLVRDATADAVADALERLIRDQGLRSKMGAAGRQLAVERFAIEIVIQKTFEVYRRFSATTALVERSDVNS